MTRRSVLAGAISLPVAARAQSWPSVVKIVVPFPPGGSIDPMARSVAPGLQQRLGCTVLIENKPGASGSLGATQVARSAPDGSTWLWVFDTHAVNPALMQLPYDSEKDLDPVLLIGTTPNMLAVTPSSPFRTLADVLSAARSRPEGVSYASVGSGSLGHLCMVVLEKRAGVRWTHVPYRGGAPAVNDTLGGHVDMIIASTALLAPQVKAGALRAIAHTGTKRLQSFPDVPTVAESGFPEYSTYAWWGLFAPHGTPTAMIDQFGQALTSTLREPAMARQFAEVFQVELPLKGPEDLRQFFAEQMRVWGQVVRENGIKA
jgi:tripartite-type tricarboxylate transporter receptor subunit TctC